LEKAQLEYDTKKVDPAGSAGYCGGGGRGVFHLAGVRVGVAVPGVRGAGGGGQCVGVVRAGDRGEAFWEGIGYGE